MILKGQNDMGKLFRITEEDLVVIEEMREASLITMEIKMQRQLINLNFHN